MKRVSFTHFKKSIFPLILILTFGFLRCSPTEELQSNTTHTTEEARDDIEKRLEKNKEVRKRIASFRKQIKSIDAVLRELNKVVNLKINGKPGDRIGSFLNVLDEVLKNSMEGLIEFRPDGSWILQKDIEFRELKYILDCDFLKIELVGKPGDHYEDFSLAVQRCDREKVAVIAGLKVHTNGDVDAYFYPEMVNDLIPDSIKHTHRNVTCSLLIADKEKKYSELSCNGPFFIENGSFSAELFIHWIRLKNNFDDIDARIELTVNDKLGKQVVRIELNEDELSLDMVPSKVKVHEKSS